MARQTFTTIIVQHEELADYAISHAAFIDAQSDPGDSWILVRDEALRVHSLFQFRITEWGMYVGGLYPDTSSMDLYIPEHFGIRITASLLLKEASALWTARMIRRSIAAIHAEYSHIKINTPIVLGNWEDRLQLRELIRCGWRLEEMELSDCNLQGDNRLIPAFVKRWLAPRNPNPTQECVG